MEENSKIRRNVASNCSKNSGKEILKSKNSDYVSEIFICSRFFHKIEDFERKKQNLKNLVCGYCDRMFQNKLELFSHMNEHKENRDPSEKAAHSVGGGDLAEGKVTRTNSGSSRSLLKHIDASKGGSQSTAAPQKRNSTSISGGSTVGPKKTIFISLLGNKDRTSNPHSLLRGSQGLAVLRPQNDPRRNQPPIPSKLPVLASTSSAASGEHAVQSSCGVNRLEFEHNYTQSSANSEKSTKVTTVPTATSVGPVRVDCTRCSKSFVSKRRLEMHEKEHVVIEEIKCKDCPLFFQRMSDLAAHESATHDIQKKPYSCRKCKKRFRNRSQLRIHVRLHGTELPYKCQFCEKQFNDQSGANDHMLFFHSKCNRCPEVLFEKKVDLLAHLHTHYLQNTKCCFCENEFNGQSELALHLNEHVKDDIFYCKTCDSKIKSVATLKAHYSQVHRRERKYSHECNACDRKFLTRRRLLIHFGSIHEGIKPFECEVCSKKYSTKCGLKEHGAVHTNERPHLCSTCGKRFKTTNLLKQHMVWHGDKPHKCTECNKAFATYGNLKKHFRVHTGERNYVCQECGDRFTRADNVRKHVKRKHPTGNVV